MFKELNKEELEEIVASGGPMRGIGYAAHAWVDFWENVGEACYDYLHTDSLDYMGHIMIVKPN